ncbi:hypothetical protein [Citrobacter cronae]|uniref:hypothetical protein n=1 Tax=Citrobacter cronae TaxID=1748967 RepID=UPI001C1005B1|nr:hypothetical protein [Citrobacter cronae]MBU5388661.1 hypothetical protein [Citrobacter cronae]
MSDARQKELEAFWLEVMHRAKMLLSDMNVGSFYQWRKTVGDRKIKRLLKLMELLLCPESNKLEINFLIEMIISQLNGQELFSCFKISGKKLIKEGMKGDIYCLPVLYVLIRYLTDNMKIIQASDFECYQESDLNQTFRFNPDNMNHI